MSLLSVNNLVTSFAIRNASLEAVSDISFSVEEGETLGIVGESGCGKSTTGFSIMRLLPNNGRISSGTIEFGGRDLVSLSEKEMRGIRGKEIALIPQDPMTSLNPVLRIGTQIGEAVRIHNGSSKREALARAVEVLKMVEMPNPEERIHQYPHELSGGLRQRAVIAMALACSPKILIADEPTTALDVTIQAQILNTLEDLKKSHELALILISHDLAVVQHVSDRIGVMYLGKLVELGTADDVFTTPAHHYTQGLLAAVPEADVHQSSKGSQLTGELPSATNPPSGCRFRTRCAMATDLCAEQEPEVREVSPGHSVACHFPITHN